MACARAAAEALEMPPAPYINYFPLYLFPYSEKSFFHVFCIIIPQPVKYRNVPSSLHLYAVSLSSQEGTLSAIRYTLFDDLELDIYPSFTNVIEALKERGIDAGKVLDTEYIESITVCNPGGNLIRNKIYTIR